MLDMLTTISAALGRLLTFIVDGGTQFINRGGDITTYAYLAVGAALIAWGMHIALDRRDYLRESGWDNDDNGWVFPAGHFVIGIPLGLIGLLRFHGHPDAVRSVVWGFYAVLFLYVVVAGVPQMGRWGARKYTAAKANAARVAQARKARPAAATPRSANPFG